MIQATVILVGFPGAASDKEPGCQCRRRKRLRFDPWVRKIPWRREWEPTPVFLPGDSHGQRSLVNCRPWGRKELDTTERLTHTHTHTQTVILTAGWIGIQNVRGSKRLRGFPKKSSSCIHTCKAHRWPAQGFRQKSKDVHLAGCEAVSSGRVCGP